MSRAGDDSPLPPDPAGAGAAEREPTAGAAAEVPGSYQVSIDHERRRVTTVFSGHVTSEVVMRYLQEEPPEAVADYPVMVDLRSARVGVSGADVWAIAAAVRQRYANRPAVVAVVVDSGLAFGLTRIAGMTMGDERRIRPFHTVAEAEAWLAAGGPER